jgi:hypothetical protein
MERRHDSPFRGLVDAVHSNLAAEGFRVADRGHMDRVTGIDFERNALADHNTLPEGQGLLLYHLGGHNHIGARFSRYELVGRTKAAQDSSTVWPYEPRTLTTPGGKPLEHALVDWLRGRLQPQPE